MNARAVPYHCPYCAETDVRPHEGDAHQAAREVTSGTAWECRGCLRAFEVTMIAQLRPDAFRASVPSSGAVTAAAANPSEAAQ